MKPKASTILDMYTNPSNRSHHILWKENRQICNILHVTTQQCKAQTNKQTNPTTVPLLYTGRSFLCCMEYMYNMNKISSPSYESFQNPYSFLKKNEI